MTAKQISEALKRATDFVNRRYIGEDGKPLEDLSHFDGYALSKFNTVTCTMNQLAALIRWQCVRFNGTVDANELFTLREVGRRKFTVIGEGAE